MKITLHRGRQTTRSITVDPAQYLAALAETLARTLPDVEVCAEIPCGCGINRLSYNVRHSLRPGEVELF